MFQDRLCIKRLRPGKSGAVSRDGSIPSEDKQACQIGGRTLSSMQLVGGCQTRTASFRPALPDLGRSNNCN